MTSRACADRAGIVVAVALGMLVLAAARPVQAQLPGDPKAVARAKLVDGGEALKRGDYKDALARFKEAYDLVPSPKIHYNFGLAYRGLGRPAEAIEAFERFLSDANDASPDLRANAERFRSELGQQVGTVVLTCDIDGADISVDGRSYGTSPSRAPLRLDPGPHQIVVEKAPAPPFTRRVELTAGQRMTVAVVLAKEPASPDPVAPAVAAPVPQPVPEQPLAPEPPPQRRHSWKWWAGWGAAAVGVGALGLGIAERMAANSKFEEFNGARGPFGECDADARVREHGGGSCSDLLSAGESAATKANVGFVVGGLLAAGGAALLALTWNETKEPGATAFTCAPDLLRPGLACGLRF